MGGCALCCSLHSALSEDRNIWALTGATCTGNLHRLPVCVVCTRLVIMGAQGNRQQAPVVGCVDKVVSWCGGWLQAACTGGSLWGHTCCCCCCYRCTLVGPGGGLQYTRPRGRGNRTSSSIGGAAVQAIAAQAIAGARHIFPTDPQFKVFNLAYVSSNGQVRIQYLAIARPEASS